MIPERIDPAVLEQDPEMLAELIADYDALRKVYRAAKYVASYCEGDHVDDRCFPLICEAVTEREGSLRV